LKREWKPLWHVVRTYAQYAKPYWKVILLSVVWVLLRVGVDILRPWPLKFVIDQALKGIPLSDHFPFARIINSMDSWHLLGVSCAMIIVLALSYGFFAWKSSACITSIGQRMTCDIRRAVFRHVQALPLPFYDRHRTGDLVTRVHNDISNIEDLLVSTVNVLLVNGLAIIGTLLMLTRLNYRFALIALLIVPALYAVARHYILSIKTAQRLAKSKDAEIASLVQENVSLIRTVQSFAQEEYEAARFEIPARAALAAGLRATGLQSRLEPSVEILTSVGTMLIVLYGARQVLLGSMTLGTLIVVLTYLQSLYSPVRQLAKMVNTMNKALISAERVTELLELKTETQNDHETTPCPELKGEISFTQVSFSYPRRVGESATAHPQVPPTLQDIHLDVKPGMSVAIIGTTGSGKTTLTSLLPRLYSPTQGTIRFDGMDLRKLERKSLRRQISVVPQDAALFRATIWENIAYGARNLPPGFSPEWIQDLSKRQACRELFERIRFYANEANAHEFIARLPDGYDTILGERGGTLSGGQRQRIAIARAMIREAPILILDEPTTGLDAASSRRVMEALDRLRQGKTSFIVAHHLRTIRDADLIVVLENGRIVEAGTHRELNHLGSRYRHFLDLAV
jgi:ABC-type multidrug transport system fused ATPase/permease subunit